MTSQMKNNLSKELYRILKPTENKSNRLSGSHIHIITTIDVHQDYNMTTYRLINLVIVADGDVYML
jgi:hypothetical protein